MKYRFPARVECFSAPSYSNPFATEPAAVVCRPAVVRPPAILKVVAVAVMVAATVAATVAAIDADYPLATMGPGRFLEPLLRRRRRGRPSHSHGREKKYRADFLASSHFAPHTLTKIPYCDARDALPRRRPSRSACAFVQSFRESRAERLLARPSLPNGRSVPR